MDIFLKRMEPEIEHVTGEERDTNTFMRINQDTDKQLDLLKSLPKETAEWDVVLGTRFEIVNIKNCLPIIEEIANPAMRTRHWKQLARVSGGTALVYI